MRISYTQLKQLDVETMLGKKLGHVSDLVLDVDGQNVLQYEIKASVLSMKQLLVGRDQVVRIDEKKMIVDDAILTESRDTSVLRSVDGGPEPVSLRE